MQKLIYPREVNMKTEYVLRKCCVTALIGALNFNGVGLQGVPKKSAIYES